MKGIAPQHLACRQWSAAVLADCPDSENAEAILRFLVGRIEDLEDAREACATLTARRTELLLTLRNEQELTRKLLTLLRVAFDLSLLLQGSNQGDARDMPHASATDT